jgi:membrane associated rhomboid family serine protease
VIVTRYPWQMLHDYPEDIQKAATLSAPTKLQNKSAKLFGLIGSLIIFATLIEFGLLQFSKAQTNFVHVLLFIFVIAMIWNVVDLLVIDWLIICKITPKWVVLEGTEGCRGYKDYFYHFKGFLIGCVYTAIMSIIIAGIDYFILKFLIWRS